MFSVGDKVDQYEIVAKLKAGGMATMFLARRSGAAGFQKHVAIKVVHEHLASDRQFVRMFVDEALLSARIHHPNVVHVEELKQQGKRHYLVMEYVNGTSLSGLLRGLARRQRRLTPELATYIAVQVADGLHAAHELRAADGSLEEVVHRDVSPQNVLLAWEGHVKLIDFGVAKAQSRLQQTTGSSLKGKIRYMSPEQAFGKSVDRRTDVYALGIVLWEMLTMRRRFEAKSDFALLDDVRAPEPIPPSRHNPAVTPELDAVVLKATAANADDRYASCQELRRGLAKALPQALALDASHLGELLTVVLDTELARARAALPSSLDMPEATQFDEEPEALRTMTVSAADVGAFFDSLSELHESDVEEVPPEANGTPAVVVSGSYLKGARSPAPGSGESSGSGGPSKLLLGVAGVVLLGAAAAGVALVISHGEEPVVTPLAPAPAVASAPLDEGAGAGEDVAEAATEPDAGEPMAEAADAGAALAALTLDAGAEPAAVGEAPAEPAAPTTMRSSGTTMRSGSRQARHQASRPGARRRLRLVGRQPPKRATRRSLCRPRSCRGTVSHPHGWR